MGINDEVRIFEPMVHTDIRGSFYESYNQSVFDDWLGREVRFVQDNHSKSVKGVLRGLHYQLPPMSQAKLVRVTSGAVFDVAVDVRRSSPTFGHWTAFELTADNRLQLWIPDGFAHGFLALTDSAEVQYKASSFFSPDHDRAIRWDDPTISIHWPLSGETPILGERDRSAPQLTDAELFD